MNPENLVPPIPPEAMIGALFLVILIGVLVHIFAGRNPDEL